MSGQIRAGRTSQKGPMNRNTQFRFISNDFAFPEPKGILALGDQRGHFCGGYIPLFATIESHEIESELKV